MTLRVPIEEFAEAVRGVVGTDRAFAQEGAGGTSLSAGAAGCGAIVLCSDPRSLSQLRPQLEEAGLKVFRGQWSLDGNAEIVTIPHVTAISYRTGGERPGIWVDAHAGARSTGASLQAMFDEFTATGQMRGTTYEEFLAAAAPTVVEMMPETLVGFVRANTEPPC